MAAAAHQPPMPMLDVTPVPEAEPAIPQVGGIVTVFKGSEAASTLLYWTPAPALTKILTARTLTQHGVSGDERTSLR